MMTIQQASLAPFGSLTFGARRPRKPRPTQTIKAADAPMPLAGSPLGGRLFWPGLGGAIAVIAGVLGYSVLSKPQPPTDSRPARVKTDNTAASIKNPSVDALRNRFGDAVVPLNDTLPDHKTGNFVFQNQFVSRHWDTPLATAMLLDCCALVIVDPAKQTQYMAHLDHQETVAAIAKSLPEGDLSQMKVYICPGADRRTLQAVADVQAALQQRDFPRANIALVDCAPLTDPAAPQVAFTGLAVWQGKLYTAPSPKALYQQWLRTGGVNVRADHPEQALLDHARNR